MKKIILITCSVLALLFSCTPQKEQISARITGWGNDTLFVNYSTLSGEKEGVDTIYAQNGHFSYTLPTADFTQLLLYRKTDLYPRQGRDYLPSSRVIELLIAPGERLKVNGKSRSDAVLEYTVSGSRLMADISKIRAQTLCHEVQKDSVEFGLIAAVEQDVSTEEEAVFFYAPQGVGL